MGVSTVFAWSFYFDAKAIAIETTKGNSALVYSEVQT